MNISLNTPINKFLIFVSLVYTNSIFPSDSYEFNLYNNYGIVGTIHTPSARTYEEGVHGATIYNGTPNQTVTLSSNPFDWLEASFFYTNIKDRPYCYDFTSEFCLQDFKDKGFNVKFRLKEQGVFPAVAIGLNDFAGTGLYSSEYIVGSYGINRQRKADVLIKLKAAGLVVVSKEPEESSEPQRESLGTGFRFYIRYLN